MSDDEPAGGERGADETAFRPRDGILADLPREALLALVDNAPDVISRFDRAGRYLFVSRAAERYTGVPREAFLGRTFRELGFTEENAALWEESVRRTFETGEPDSIEFSVPLPVGLRHFEGSSVAERGPDGRVTSVLTVTRDVTERVLAEARLGGEAERLRLALDAARMGTWEWSVATGALTWAGHLEEIHGMPPGSFDGRFESYVAAIHPDDRERVLAEISGALAQGGGAFHTEFRVTYPDNTLHWVAGEGRAFFDAATGKPERMVGVGWDITAAKRVEEELRDAAERLRRSADLFRLTDQPLVVAGENPRVIEMCNPAFSRLYGYDAPEELVGVPVLDLYAPAWRERAAARILESHATGRVVFEAEHRRRDGTLFPVEVDITAVRDDAGRLLYRIVNVTDITDRKRAEDALRARAERDALLNRIGDAVRALSEPEEVLAAAVREMGRAMKADRCYFAEYDVARDWARVGADWRRPDLPSLSGVYRLSALDVDAREMFGGPDGLLHADDLEAAEPVFSPRAAATLRALGLRSILGVALSENGHPVAALVAAMADAPRAWTPEEVELLRAAAALTRAAMEDARQRKREHAIAERLQDALQPSIRCDAPDLAVNACYVPALSEATIGGDFYDVFPLRDGVHALVVADLSGKGLAAAAQVATVRHMLRALLYRRGATLAGSVTELNAMLSEHELLAGFATLFVGAYDAAGRTLSYVNAGQEPGLLRRAATGAMEELWPTGPVLGGFGEAAFEERAVTLAPGDVLAVFTDGLTEAGPSRKRLLGPEGVAEVFEACCAAAADSDAASPEAIAAGIMRGVEARATPTGVRDDVCLLVARVREERR